MAAKKPKDPRKIKYSTEQIKEIVIELTQYVDTEDFPDLAGFLSKSEIRHKFKLTSQYIVDHPETFSNLLNAIQSKCEHYLVKQALRGVAIPSAIFLLKQNKYGGYADKQELDLTSQSQPIKFISKVNRPKKQGVS